MPLSKGKAKVMNDLDSRKTTISTPLLLEQVEFEGKVLLHILVLNMQEGDLANHEILSHLDTSMYMKKIYYEEIGVTQLEPMKWVRGAEKARLLYILCVPHFHRSIINMVCTHHMILLCMMSAYG